LATEKLLNRKISELTALYEVSKTLASSLDLKVTSQKIFEILHDTLGLRRGTLVLEEAEGGGYGIWAAHGLSKEEITRGRYAVGEGITGKVLQKGTPIIVPDIGKEPLFLNKTKARDLKRQNVSFLCVPIQVQGKTLGVLSADRIFDDDSVGFEEDIRFLTVLASLVGQAVKLSNMVAKEKEVLMEENTHLHEELKSKYRLASVVGTSRKMEAVYEIVERVAKSKSTVLLRGESGTGKELIARALHYNSPRADKSFIRVSCAALPETLLESELFGHEKGSFTGAFEARKGRFELADGGSLFLDEIADISASTQVKLLRVLQERKFERVGGTKTLSVDVRIITATNRDLEVAVKNGGFREDLYYRLNVIPIHLPPLREREEDVSLLIEHFLKRFNAENGRELHFTKDAMERLLAYTWPGNVRELENCIERMVVLANAQVLDVGDLPLAIRSNLMGPDAAGALAGPVSGSLPDTVQELEKARIVDTLRRCHGIQSHAAKALGLTVRQLGYKVMKYRIEPKAL
jgi:Nif-specific regulatory protein